MFLCQYCRAKILFERDMPLHLRDKHPEILNKIQNPNTIKRKLRKRNKCCKCGRIMFTGEYQWRTECLDREVQGYCEECYKERTYK